MINQRLSCHDRGTDNMRRARTRRGNVLGLMAVLLPILAVLSAFCINCAQMQLTRTELMIATDAAARAAGRTFSELQTVYDAKQAAMITAALNDVGGEPLQLETHDAAGEIEFGVADQPNGLTGRYHFNVIPTSEIESGETIASSVRIVGRRESGSLSGRVPLYIPGLLNANDFSTVQSAVAMQVDRDISLVLDRSGSMEEIDWNWPSGTSPWNRSTKRAGVEAGLLYRRRGEYYYTAGNDSTSYQQWAWEEHYGLGPAPTSPWQDLIEAVNAFLNVLDATSQEEQVSVSSYATSATLDAWLEKDFDVVRNTVGNLDTGGWTAIGDGMSEGIQTLLEASARPYAAKTMVVMTDGIHNTGSNPDDVARELMSSYNLTIHTVTFGAGADQDLMRQVADIGGGNHYHAATGAELVEIFEEIANNLPTILTK